jgi:hypothetical protein
VQTQPPQEPASLVALRRTFASIAGHAALVSRAEVALLREQATDVVHDLKNAGELPERVIVIVRHAARDEKIDGAGDLLLDDVVNWCIAEYFAGE